MSHKTGVLTIVIRLVVNNRQSVIIRKETKGKGSKLVRISVTVRQVDIDLYVSKVGVCQ